MFAAGPARERGLVKRDASGVATPTASAGASRPAARPVTAAAAGSGRVWRERGGGARRAREGGKGQRERGKGGGERNGAASRRESRREEARGGARRVGKATAPHPRSSSPPPGSRRARGCARLHAGERRALHVAPRPANSTKRLPRLWGRFAAARHARRLAASSSGRRRRSGRARVVGAARIRAWRAASGGARGALEGGLARENPGSGG